MQYKIWKLIKVNAKDGIVFLKKRKISN